MNREVLKAVAYVASGLVVGGGVTFLITKNRLKAHYEQIADEEIESMKEHYKLLHKEGEFATPESAVEHLDRAEEEVIEAGREFIEALGYVPGQDDVTITVAEGDHEGEQHASRVVNIFEENNPHYREPGEEDVPSFSFETVRDRTKPYVIPVEEFMNGEQDYDKTTITYYEDDDTLCDEREQFIPDVEGTVGSENLHKFGEGSDSESTVYVRNERFKTDFEVILNKGAYSKIVLGMDEYDAADVREPRRGVKRMRDDE